MARTTEILEALSGVALVVLASAVAAPAGPSGSASQETHTEPPNAVATERPTPDAPPRAASYVFRARLDESAHKIAANGTITWRNTARVAVSELYFHLYLNAFKNERSLFLRSPFDERRSGARAEDWGTIDVERLVAREFGTDLWPTRTPGTRDEPEDETDVRLPLPRAVAPGETLTLDVSFSAKLPAIVERTGYQGAFHFVAQWFPKLARVESDGTFAHFPFHPQAEFYADFGDYDVTLDVPAEAIVGATGRLVETSRTGARRTERYQAGPVHDFAWTAWPGFRERRARVGNVDVRLLYPPDSEENAELELAAVRKGLPRFSRLFGDYPYPTLTVVHPPDRAAAAGGMEYPTLITTGGPWYAPWFGPRAIESLTLHELLHQWFYGIVATDETRFPFLDEGITTYAEISTLDALYGTGSALRAFGVELAATSLARSFSTRRGEDVSVASPAAAFPGFRSLAALVYSRTGIALETLARVYGREKLDRAIGRYAREHRFGHPTPDDFFRTVRAELGERAALALERALVRRGRVDFLIRELETAPERAPAGVFDQKDGRKTVPTTAPSSDRFRGRVVVFRHGDIELPVEVELVSENGERRRVHWDGQGSHRVIDWSGSSPLAFATLDPDHRILLDDDLTNNAAARAPKSAARTLERAVYVGELVLAGFAP